MPDLPYVVASRKIKKKFLSKGQWTLGYFCSVYPLVTSLGFFGLPWHTKIVEVPPQIARPIYNFFLVVLQQFSRAIVYQKIPDWSLCHPLSYLFSPDCKQPLQDNDLTLQVILSFIFSMLALQLC